MNEYAINIFWSEEDGEYIAVIPDLRGCSASGETPEEALKEVQIAKQLWLETAQEQGDPIPEPRWQPEAPTKVVG